MALPMISLPGYNLIKVQDTYLEQIWSFEDKGKISVGVGPHELKLIL